MNSRIARKNSLFSNVSLPLDGPCVELKFEPSIELINLFFKIVMNDIFFYPIRVNNVNLILTF